MGTYLDVLVVQRQSNPYLPTSLVLLKFYVKQSSVVFVCK